MDNSRHKALEQEIQCLGMDNPMVRRALDLHATHSCTWEEAMMLLSIDLANVNSELQARLTDVLMRSPVPMIVPIPDMSDYAQAPLGVPYFTKP